MLVMFEVTDPVERDHAMTKREGKGEVVDLKGLLLGDDDFVRSAVQTLVQHLKGQKVQPYIDTGCKLITKSSL